MTEENPFQSALGSPSMCQDTFRILMNILGDTSDGTLPALNLTNPSNNPYCGNNILMPDGKSTLQFLGELSSEINIPSLQIPTPQVPSPEVPSPQVPSPHPTMISLPAVSDWPGKHSFAVFIESQEPTPKKISYTYSRVCKKLYVKKDAPCPINFSTEEPMREGVLIRAMAVYSEPKHTFEAVTRCINHASQDSKQLQTKFEDEKHLIRCESAQPFYEIDSKTSRHSVCVPYENPPVGQDFSTYLYRFACYSSCPGGPNRRPITLIFTLEQGNEVIGRRCFELKICACPGRDKKSDEMQSMGIAGVQEPIALEPQFGSAPKRVKRDHENNQAVVPEKKADVGKSGKKPRKDLMVKAIDEHMYNFLVQMKNFYVLSNKASALANSSKLYLLVTSSDEEDRKN